jgi:hypothetical protein
VLSLCLETRPSKPSKQACRNRSGPISPCSKSERNIPSTRRATRLPHAERQPAEILAVADQAIEGVELDLMVVPARVQAVEIRPAVDAEQHGFAVDDKGRIAVTQRGLNDKGILTAPVVAISSAARTTSGSLPS